MIALFSIFASPMLCLCAFLSLSTSLTYLKYALRYFVYYIWIVFVCGDVYVYVEFMVHGLMNDFCFSVPMENGEGTYDHSLSRSGITWDWVVSDCECEELLLDLDGGMGIGF